VSSSLLPFWKKRQSLGSPSASPLHHVEHNQNRGGKGVVYNGNFKDIGEKATLIASTKIIDEIENNLEHVSDSERKFLRDFIEWLKEALKHTTIIVVEGNL